MRVTDYFPVLEYKHVYAAKKLSYIHTSIFVFFVDFVN